MFVLFDVGAVVLAGAGARQGGATDKDEPSENKANDSESPRRDNENPNEGRRDRGGEVQVGAVVRLCMGMGHVAGV